MIGPRRRGIFSAPPLHTAGRGSAHVSRKVLRRGQFKHHRHFWAAKGLLALSSLAGFAPSDGACKVPSVLSDSVVEIEKKYFQLAKPPASVRSDGAFSELLSTCGSHFERADLASHDRSSLALPAKPQPLSLASHVRVEDQFYITE